MDLFYVTYTNEDGDTLDHFVRAFSAQEAAEYWAEATYPECRVIPPRYSKESDGSVYTVPGVSGGQAGPVSWDDVPGFHFDVTFC